MLAHERQVSPATHRQALNGLMFLYLDVLCIDLPWMNQIGRPPERKRIPVVLTTVEIQQVLALLPGVEGVLARLLYGTGIRLSEGLSLRVKDMDFDRHVVIVGSGKGGNDRVVMLPRSLAPALREQLASSRALWAADRAAGHSGVFVGCEVPARRAKLDLALGVPGPKVLRGPPHRGGATPPSV